MSDLPEGWRMQLASDVIRDGMGLELLDPSEAIVAEVFRCDADKTVTVETSNRAIPVEVFDMFYTSALVRLEPFEDGTTFASRGIPSRKAAGDG